MHDPVSSDIRLSRWPHNRLLWPATCLAVFFLQLGIRPDLVTKPQFWAEDATQWFLEAYTDNTPDDLLKPYNGYLHLIPRIVAHVFVGNVSLSLVPLIFNLAALLVSSISLSLFVLPEFRRIVASDITRIGIVLFVTIANPSGEILGTLTNAQWYAGLGALQAVYLARRNALVTVFEGLFLLLAAFSAPTLAFLSFLLVPIAVRSDRYRRTKALLLLAAIGAHFGASRILGDAPTMRTLDLPYLRDTAPDTLGALLSVSLLGYPATIRLVEHVGDAVPWIMIATLTAAAAWLALRGRAATRAFAIGTWFVLVSYAVGIVALRTDIFSRGNDAILLASAYPSFDEYNHSRFFFIPFCLVTVMTVRVLEALDRRRSSKEGRHHPVFQLAFLLTGLLRTAFFPEPVYLGWTTYAEKMERGWYGSMPVQPTAWGWNVRIPKLSVTDQGPRPKRSILDALTDQPNADSNKRVVPAGTTYAEAFFQHAPGSASVARKVEGRYLRLIYGLDPRARAHSDGVTFEVVVTTTKGRPVSEWSSARTPSVPLPGGWRCSTLDVGALEGKRALLTFRTLPGPTFGYDWALWLEPVFSDDENACREAEGGLG